MLDQNAILSKLSKSKFRNSFHLKEKDFLYIENKGIEKIKNHAYDFLNKRIRIKLPNDGKQTPMHGHPVFIAQHACAICCRGCINKWYHFPIDRNLNDDEIEYLISIIMLWIEKEYQRWKDANGSI